MNEDWRIALRLARRSASMSMQAVAQQAGLSYETVRGYENGRRHPTRASLRNVLAALRLTAAEANELLIGAGFAAEPNRYLPDEFPEYPFRVQELQRVIDGRPWPVWATNDAMHVIAANRTIQALWGVDFAREKRRRKGDELSLFAIGGDLGFTQRMTNWPTAFGVAASLAKGQPQRNLLGAPRFDFDTGLRAMSGGDPAMLKQLRRVWANAKPAATRIQGDFPVIWQDPELGEMRFRSVTSVASEQDRLHFRDWHPVDAETWNVLEQVKARWAKRRSKRKPAR